MSLQSLVSRYRKKLKEEQEAIDFGITSGRCHDFSAYKHQCGVTEGINKALDILDEELKQEDKDDDDD